MPSNVRDLPSLATVTTSSTASNAIGKLDDASSITIFFTSSATVLSSGNLTIQISQFDPFDPFPPQGVVESSAWYTVSTSNPTSTGPLAVALTNVSFRGLRLQVNLTSGNTAGDIIAFVSKQISV